MHELKIQAVRGILYFIHHSCRIQEINITRLFWDRYVKPASSLFLFYIWRYIPLFKIISLACKQLQSIIKQNKFYIEKIIIDNINKVKFKSKKVRAYVDWDPFSLVKPEKSKKKYYFVFFTFKMGIFIVAHFFYSKHCVSLFSVTPTNWKSLFLLQFCKKKLWKLFFFWLVCWDCDKRSGNVDIFSLVADLSQLNNFPKKHKILSGA